MASETALPSRPPEPSAFRLLVIRAGRGTLDLIRFGGGVALLCRQIVSELFSKPFYFRLTVEQVFHIGVQSFLLVMVTGLATGSVMALQFGYGLQRFGGTLYVPKIVALSIVREMGPVFTSLLVAGRIGSGIASEVASMKVTQQIDAIRALGTSPIKRIVIPRLLACLIALPILTLFANFIGIMGAMAVCSSELGISAGFFISKTLETVKDYDLYSGLLKTVIFGFFIAIVSTWKGLNTEGGTQGVGQTTTWVVVTASIFIMISDFFMTKIFIVTLYPH